MWSLLLYQWQLLLWRLLLDHEAMRRGRLQQFRSEVANKSRVGRAYHRRRRHFLSLMLWSPRLEVERTGKRTPQVSVSSLIALSLPTAFLFFSRFQFMTLSCILIESSGERITVVASRLVALVEASFLWCHRVSQQHITGSSEFCLAHNQ